jgi:hypothetical protein
MTSGGIRRKYPARMIVANDTLKTMLTSARPGRLLMSPRVRKIEKSGTMSTSVGMISGARMTRKSAARTGGRRQVSANAAGTASPRAPATVNDAT